MFLEVWDAKRKSEEQLKKMEEGLTLAWNALSVGLFESLINSMLQRVEPVLAADGWHTKY